MAGNGKSDLLLEVHNLVKYFPVHSGLMRRVSAWVRAVDDVSFFVRRGETLGLVGESGCGKTTLGRTILRLIEPTSGSVYFESDDVAHMSPKDLKRARRDMQIIFQDPFSSLDPRMPIGQSIGEGLEIHGVEAGSKRQQMVHDALQRVGLFPEHAGRYPHEFSGGQRQRVGIARALVLRPKFIVCDEPVSALDVSIQSQVLNLLRRLQAELGLTYLFVAHDLSVVEHISDRVAVMYVGKIVELAGRDQLYADPLHPYTKSLMSAIPVPNPKARRKRIILSGDVPSPLNPPSGCRFHPRCPVAVERCSQEEPGFREVKPDHWVACHLVADDGELEYDM
jgi:peptide/nickel transport system ATP-binding protein/oligopeptide transport system ATP-binding protein